jgi:hypothetical protein
MTNLRAVNRWHLLALVGAGTLLGLGFMLASTSQVGAVVGDPRILPPASRPYLQPYSAWDAQWWTWVIEQGFYPLVDQTGEHCADGQSGRVWFLGGSFAGAPVTRQCTITTDKALFFPIQNWFWIQFPEDPPYDIAAMRAYLAAQNDATGGRSASIDGVPVLNLDTYRTRSGIFYAFLPGDNALGLPEMLTGPNVDDGWYLFLKPLTAGNHTIHFTGADGLVDVTYNLTVVRSW